jgi:DNA-directed RNA polymerase III subunit RPC8
MFQIATLEDCAVKIPPSNLGKSTLEAVTQELESSYVDKVVPELGGLCVTLYEITRITGGTVLAGEGCVCFEVTFRLVVFKPFAGEVLEGTLISTDRYGARCSVGFFGDIFVPARMMQTPSEYDEAEETWVWNYNDERFVMTRGDDVRVKVVNVRFPTHPKTAEELDSLQPESGLVSDGSFAPMVVIATIDLDGCGMSSWWSLEDDETEADALDR